MKTLVFLATVLLAVPAMAANFGANGQFSAQPGQPVYSIWAYKLTDGQWVKSDQYSWTTSDPRLGWQYARKVNAVPGWVAMTNLPTPTSQALGVLNRGPVQISQNGAQTTISIAGWTVSVPSSMIPRDANGDIEYGSSSDSNDWTSDYGDTSDIDASNRTQDMINNQMQSDQIQDMINTQNMIDTQNMINTQNMVEQQNAAAAQMNANP